MRATIVQAIAERACLLIHYAPGDRTIEPHALGHGSDGQLLLRAYQRSGASDSGEHVEWKLFRVDRIRSINGGGANFDGPRPGYRRGDRAMKGGIIAQV